MIAERNYLVHKKILLAAVVLMLITIPLILGIALIAYKIGAPSWTASALSVVLCLGIGRLIPALMNLWNKLWEEK